MLDFNAMKLKVGQPIGRGYNHWFWSKCPYPGEAFKVTLDGGACALGAQTAWVSRMIYAQTDKSTELGRALSGDELIIAQLRKLPHKQYFVGYDKTADAKEISTQGHVRIPVPQADGSTRHMPWLRFRFKTPESPVSRNLCFSCFCLFST